MQEIAPGVARTHTSFVNAYFIGEPGGPWALVDTGLPGFSATILAAAAERYGPGARPEAIFLTHGHFDHAGNALALANHWDVPIYTHRLELPYLTGRSDYAPPDPTVGGAIAMFSRVLPYGSRDLGGRLRVLTPDDEASGAPGGDGGPLPGFEGWRWLHTPGHCAGHVAFHRASDRTLLAGDALATVNMDSYLALTRASVAPASQPTELHVGGAPFISDWAAYGRSVQTLSTLDPVVVACGHGAPMTGGEVAGALERFAANLQPPPHGRYVEDPARADERGVDWVPPAPADAFPFLVGAAGIGLVLALVFYPKKRV